MAISQTGTTADTPAARGLLSRVGTCLLIAGPLTCATNLVIALIARLAGVPAAFEPLQARPLVVSTVAGVLLGALGWLVISRRATAPARVLRLAVPGVVLASILPVLAMGFTGSEASSTWGGVAALVLMHVAVAAIAVPTYSRLLPLAR